LGSYRIELLLGRGGMGVVYRAEDLRLGRKVALKLLASHLTEDAHFRSRFLAESRLAASIDHAGIVPIYEAGESDGHLYIAMRYVEGTDLGSLLRREGAMEPQRVIELVAQLGQALDAAHARGLVHRDVKPSNALIAMEGTDEHVYLADFGLTRRIATIAGATASDPLVGTVDYLAPERIAGEPADGRADMYSLGCVLFEALTGEVPFPRESEVATIYAHLEDEPPRPSERRPGVPVALDAVVARALAKDPERRWQSGAELAVAARAALSAPAAGVGSKARASVPRRAVVAGLALVALASGAVVALVSRSGDGVSLRAISENAVGLIDPGSGRIRAQFPVGHSPTALTVGGGSIWALNKGDRSITRIDRTHDERVTIPVGDDPAGLAFAARSLWVTDRQDRTVSRISADTNRPLRTIKDVANGPTGIAAGFRALWVASEVDRTVSRIDLARGTVTKRIAVGASPTAVATGAGAVWVASEEGGTVFRIEPRSGTVVKAIDVGNGPIGVAVGEGAVWVANRQDSTVSRIDPATNAVTTTVSAGKEPSAIAAGAGAVWVANGGEATVSRIDPAGRTPPETIAVGGSPTAIAVSAGSVFTAAVASPATHRGGTLRMESPPYAYKHIEPANYDPDSYQIASLAYDGLLAYRRAGGATYGTLVGDLATGVPDPSADRRTYVFTLRHGIRYSDGELVRASDFRAALESLLRRHGKQLPPTKTFYARIVGASACARRPRDCDLSKGIVADDRAGTVTIRLTAPDPDILHKLAHPFAYIVPAAHPFGGKTEPPGTGPYRIVSFDPNRGARLVRNTHFHVWSQDARPDGFPDKIVIQAGQHLHAQVAAVRRGKADLLLVSDVFGGPLPASQVATLRASAPGQLHTDAEPEVDYMFMDVRRPPFDNIRVRRAINYAVDRHAIDDSAGGPDLATSTCQIVPPGFPGYKPSCPYTADPSPSGAWNGADFVRARRLIEQSGTSGTKITVWGYEAKRSILRYFVSLLGQLGYDGTMHVYPDYYTYIKAAPAKGAQIGIQGFAADFGAPSNFTEPFRCDERHGVNSSRFCNRRIDANIDAAESEGTAAADSAWPHVFRLIEEAAPIVPLVNRRTVALVSERVGNYQYHRMWGPLLDQMWVR
jgi:YVTN family beta-propeller protein